MKTSCCELSRLPFLSPALSANARPAPAGWGPTRALRVRGAERVRTGSRQSPWRSVRSGALVPHFTGFAIRVSLFHPSTCPSIGSIHPSSIHPPTHPSSIIHPTTRPPILPGASAVAGRAILSVLPSLAVTPPPTARRPSAPRGPSRSCPHTSGVTGVGPRQADFALSCRATQTCPVPGVRGRVRPRCDGSVRAGGTSHLSPGQEGGAGSTQRLGRLLCRISRGLPAPLTAPGAARWRPRVGVHEHSSHCRRRRGPGVGDGDSRAPSAGRAMPSVGQCLALDAPPPQPRVRAHARTVFCAKPGVGWGAPACSRRPPRPAVYLLSAVHGTSQARGRMSETVCKPDTRARCALRSRRGSQLGVSGPPRSFATSGDIFVVVTDMRGGVVRI